MASQASSAKPTPAFDLKGRMATLTILRVLDANLDRCLDELERRLAEAPSFFDGMPVVLDLDSVKDAQVDAAWVSEFAHHLWQHNLAPLAVLAGDGRMEDVGRGAGLGVMRPPGGAIGGDSDNSRRTEAGEPRKAQEPSKAQEELPNEEESAATVTRLVTQPVRSGQQVYARGGDLIVLSTVSPGAEVLADGNIHIYGGLRGRALAGVQGNTEARIFCQNLNAELIAIAGRYQVSEHIAELDRGRQVQVFLSGDALCIQPLGSNVN